MVKKIEESYDLMINETLRYIRLNGTNRQKEMIKIFDNFSNEIKNVDERFCSSMENVHILYKYMTNYLSTYANKAHEDDDHITCMFISSIVNILYSRKLFNHGHPHENISIKLH